MVIANLIVSLRADITQYDKDLNRAIASAEKFSGGLRRVGRDLTLGVSLPLIAMGGFALKASINFEQAMAGVQKTTNATDAELAQLSRTFTDMSERIPVSAVKLGELGQVAGQLGIETDNIAKFTEVMAALGVSTNLSAEDAANGLARLANITGTSQDQFEQMGSTLVALGNNLATTEAEIIEMALRIGGAGKTVGLTTAEVLSMAAGLSSLGIRAESGGSAISRVMIEIANSVSEGGDRLEAFARTAQLPVQDFANLFRRDAAGAILAFIEGLGKLDPEAQNTFAVLKELGLNNIRVRDIVLRGANAQGALRDAINLGNESWRENSALAREAGIFYETTGNQIKVVINRVINLARAFGDGLAPVIVGVLEASIPVLNVIRDIGVGFTALPGPIRAVIVGIGGLVIAIGPLLVGLGLLLGAITSISAALAIGGAVSLAATIGVASAAIVAIGAVVLGVIGYFRRKKTAVDELSSAFGKIPGEADKAGTSVNRLVGNLEKLDPFRSAPAPAGPQSFLNFALGAPAAPTPAPAARADVFVPDPDEIARLEKITDVWAELDKNITKVNDTFGLLGGTFDDVLQGRVNASRAALERLLDLGVDPTDAGIRRLAASIREMEHIMNIVSRDIPIRDMSAQADRIRKEIERQFIGDPIKIVVGIHRDSFGRIKEFYDKFTGGLPIRVPETITTRTTSDVVTDPRTSMQKLVDNFNIHLKDPLKAIGGGFLNVMKAINPFGFIMEAVGEAFGDLIVNMTPIVEVLAKAFMPILKALFPVLKLVIIAATYVGQVFFTIAGGILKAIGHLVKGLGALIEKLPGVGDFGLKKAGQAMIDLGKGFGEASDELGKARDQIKTMEWKDVADKMDKVNEELTNMPTGFKFFLRQFQASEAEGFLAGTPGADLATEPEGAKTTTFNIRQILMNTGSSNPREVWEAFKEGARQAVAQGDNSWGPWDEAGMQRME